MIDDEMAIWTDGSAAVGISKSSFEKLKIRSGYNSDFYKTNHKRLVKYLQKDIAASAKIAHLKKALHELIQEKIRWDQETVVRDSNSYNPDEIATHLLIEWVKRQIDSYKELQNLEIESAGLNIEKLTFLGTPPQFGYIFTELARTGFVELPSTHGEGSYSKYAKTCWEMFNFKSNTTIKNLEKEMNPKKNTLSPTMRARFVFPDSKELNSKKKR